MAEQNEGLKKQHRSTIFRGYYSIPKNFVQLLNLCRNWKNEITENDIKPLDLESTVAIRTWRNDVSFITSDNRLIILIEHQSTINPNMAFRLFLYYVELLQMWININEVNIYGTAKIQELPKPEFYVAYNGSKPLKEHTSEFKLKHNDVKIEVIVNIVDINFKNLKRTEPSDATAGYAYFYKIYNEGINTGLSRDKAFTRAREACISGGYMGEFIKREEFIVNYKNFLDYEAQLVEGCKEEARNEGKREGILEGKLEGILAVARKMLSRNKSINEIMEDTGLSKKEIESLAYNV